MKKLKKFEFIEKNMSNNSTISFLPKYLLSQEELNSVQGGFGDKCPTNGCNTNSLVCTSQNTGGCNTNNGTCTSANQGGCSENRGNCTFSNGGSCETNMMTCTYTNSGDCNDKFVDCWAGNTGMCGANNTLSY